MTCAAEEPKLIRALRLLGTALLVLTSLITAASARTTIEVAGLDTFLRLGLFVASLGMLACSIAAFWWRTASLRRLEWTAYLGLALLLAEQSATRSNNGQAQPVALLFALLVISLVVARMTRRSPAEDVACNCG